MRHPVERAQKIVDRLYERNTRLKFEAIEKNDSVLIYIKNEDNESIGVIEVPDNVNDLCKYYPGIGWLSDLNVEPGMGIEIVNMDIREVE